MRGGILPSWCPDCSAFVADNGRNRSVSILHRLGKQEAVRRLKTGLGQARTSFSHLMSVDEEVWNGDCLTFRLRALCQSASDTIDVAEDHLRLEVSLPWLLAKLSERLVPAIRKEGILLLEKK